MVWESPQLRENTWPRFTRLGECHHPAAAENTSLSWTRSKWRRCMINMRLTWRCSSMSLNLIFHLLSILFLLNMLLSKNNFKPEDLDQLKIILISQCFNIFQSWRRTICRKFLEQFRKLLDTYNCTFGCDTLLLIDCWKYFFQQSCNRQRTAVSRVRCEPVLW